MVPLIEFTNEVTMHHDPEYAGPDVESTAPDCPKFQAIVDVKDALNGYIAEINNLGVLLELAGIDSPVEHLDGAVERLDKALGALPDETMVRSG